SPIANQKRSKRSLMRLPYLFSSNSFGKSFCYPDPVQPPNGRCQTCFSGGAGGGKEMEERLLIGFQNFT
ncbi:hypothetical protein, partial [Neolewinella agarilytica]|uniref:hypothetical protein n=1 Tax=Neolewinella agarilytica TaxID=478744 RepID=UPI00235229E6